jgi:hypothetical protein
MRSVFARVLHVTAIGITGFTWIGVPSAAAQTRATSIDELRRVLGAGDTITLVTGGAPIRGRLVRIGDADLDLRPSDQGRIPEKGRLNLTIPLNEIQSLERPRDSVRNGTIIGAVSAAGFGGALFIYATAVDRNEIDEWAPAYLAGTAILTGIGALAGWAIDAAVSKPYVRFDRAPGQRTKISVQPYVRGRGIGLSVSFVR